MAIQLLTRQPAGSRQFTLRDVMIWIGVLGFLWGVPRFWPPLTAAAILASSVFIGFILKRITGSRRFLYVPLVMVLLFCGHYFLLTGAPFPICRIERLHAPVAVRQVTKETLQLVDGRRVTLPMIKELPADDAVFQTALQHGVEVSDGGHLIGLVRWPKFCGNDPVIYDLRRIDLTELAAALHPAGIDDKAVPAAEIAQLVASQRTWGRNDRLPVFQLSEVRLVLERTSGTIK